MSGVNGKNVMSDLVENPAVHCLLKHMHVKMACNIQQGISNSTKMVQFLKYHNNNNYYCSVSCTLLAIRLAPKHGGAVPPKTIVWRAQQPML